MYITEKQVSDQIINL